MPPWFSRNGLLVGHEVDDGLVGDKPETPDGIPAQPVLSTVVEYARVSELDGEGNGMPGGVVTDHGGVVVGGSGVPGNVLGLDLRGLDEYAVVVPADFPEHEASRLRVAGHVDELGVIPELAALGGVDEADVHVAEPRDVLRRQRQHAVLDQGGGEGVIAGGKRGQGCGGD